MASEEPEAKRPRTETPNGAQKITAASLASLPRAIKAPNGVKPVRQERRDPPVAAPRSPSPIAQERSPPRKRKRPGITRTVQEKTTAQQALEDKKRRDLEVPKNHAGSSDAIREHYNNVQQRGREWRKTESKIKGLRSLNNWIKSTMIHKFASNQQSDSSLLVLDIGCGKGGDLQKWHAAPQAVELYVGFDPADVSIAQAKDRYQEMLKKQGYGPRGRQRRPLFQAEFGNRDCFTTPVAETQVVSQVLGRAGGFDIVSMMFCLHYAFETEQKARIMLRNVASSLKKGGKLLGCIPNSEIINSKLADYHAKRGVAPAVQEQEESSDDEWDPEKPSMPQTAEQPASSTPVQDVPEELEFGNNLYTVRVPRAASFPTDGIYRPPFGWRYTYFLEEAVEAPEFVVPWAAFRALAAEFGLELQWERSFNKIWEEESRDREMRDLSQRMGVVDRDTGELKVTEQEMDAASFYKAFCFYKG